MKQKRVENKLKSIKRQGKVIRASFDVSNPDNEMTLVWNSEEWPLKSAKLEQIKADIYAFLVQIADDVLPDKIEDVTSEIYKNAV